MTHSIAEAVYLSTKIVVMSPRPGRIVKVIQSKLPDERHLGLRDSADFIALAHEVREAPCRWPPLNRASRNAGCTNGLPVAVVLLAVLLIWYVAAWALNAPGAIERVLDADAGYTQRELFEATMTMERPLMPAPHQVVMDFYESLTEWPIDSPRNLLYHVAVTGQSTLLGFVMGTAAGAACSRY